MSNPGDRNHFPVTALNLKLPLIFQFPINLACQIIISIKRFHLGKRKLFETPPYCRQYPQKGQI